MFGRAEASTVSSPLKPVIVTIVYEMKNDMLIHRIYTPMIKAFCRNNAVKLFDDIAFSSFDLSVTNFVWTSLFDSELTVNVTK
jgi:hypothetical protein